ncbi:hypothetical protein RQP46_002601 [Phenoliferia psychrophenolica]
MNGNESQEATVDEERIAQLEAKMDLEIAIYRAVLLDSTDEQKASLAQFLFAKAMARRNLGFQAINWKLALPAMAKELTLHLIDSCFARLPAFTALIERLQPYNMDSLEASPMQVTITVLCALGARSSPHSALLGITVPDNQAASAALLLTIVQAYFEPGSSLGAEVLSLPLARARLSEQVDSLLHHRTTRTEIEQVLFSSQAWLSSLQRTFALIATAQDPSALPVHPSSIKRLWQAIDDVHSVVQRFQKLLVNLDYIPDGMDTLHTNVDRHVLLAARIDTRLADLCYYMHDFIKAKVTELPHEPAWHELLLESDLRVRKCIKLSAFYYSLFLGSADKHIVYTLTLQMEAMSNWTQIACQRVGTPGGPPSFEFEVSEEELEWISKGLQIACFYTPRAAPRLQELEGGRRLIAAHREAGSPLPASTFTPYDDVYYTGQDAGSSYSMPASSPADQDPFQYDMSLPNDTSFDFSNLGQVQGTEKWNEMALTDAWDGRDEMGDLTGGYEFTQGGSWQ